MMTPQFIVYIDEAGDPGVKAKDTSRPHWSDWFVLAAVVISVDREPEAVEWVQEMGRAIKRLGPPNIHYRKLSDANRRHVCEVVASKPLRAFVVASHKTSMRNHHSPRLGRASDRKFYNWCLRLLLERVTEWCAARCRKEGSKIGPVRIIFSERGGHDYEDLRGYLQKIEAQTITGNLTLDCKSIVPGMIYDSLCEVVPHSNLAGLQLADVVASAFFQAVGTSLPRHSLDPARMLLGRLARRSGQRRPQRFGLMLLPFAHQGDIPTGDRAIFELGGYSFGHR